MAEKYLVSLISLVFLAAVAIFAGQAQGADLCAKAEFVPLCQSVVKGATDPKAALKTSIEYLISETKKAVAMSEKLGKTQHLTVCKDNLNSALDDLHKSLEYLESGDKNGLKTVLTGASTYYVTCDDAVAEGGIVQLAADLLAADTKLQRMANNCLHLSSLLVV